MEVADHATGDESVSNGLIDLLTPIGFTPLFAAVFWPWSTPGRIFAVCIVHVLVTLVFATSVWNVERRMGLVPWLADAWTISSALVIAAIPWIIQPTSVGGYTAIALCALLAMASDTLFLGIRSTRSWHAVIALEGFSTAMYFVVQREWKLLFFIAVVMLHLFGGYQAIRLLLDRLKSEREHSEQLSRTDPLTRLGNRRELTRELERLSRRGERVALALIDVDDFKRLNDRHGHFIGDEALVALGQVLVQRLGSDWLVVRSGGDEFVALTTTPFEEPDRAAFAPADITVVGQSLGEVTFSVGITSGRADEDLLADASDALRDAKHAGKNHVVIIDKERRASVQRRRVVSTELGPAIENGDITLAAQPIVDINGNVNSYECLARWVDATGTAIPPTVFVPMAERQRLAGALGELVLRQAADFAAGLDFSTTVAVNISASHFATDGFVAVVHEVLSNVNMPADCLRIEVTESESLKDSELWVPAANRLRALGVKLAIDDFGSGYSSLSRLVNLPLTQLKLDKTLTSAAESLSVRRLIAGLTAFADASGVEVVAEGIETKEEAQLLSGLGVKLLQGYYFARPMPVELVLQAANAPTHTDQPATLIEGMSSTAAGN